MKLGSSPRHSRKRRSRGRRLGDLGRLRGAGDRLLAEILRPDAPLCRHQPHRRRQARPVRGEGDRRRAGRKDLSISGLGYYPNPLHPTPDIAATVIGPSEEGDRRRQPMGVPVVNTFCGGDAAKTVDANWEDALKVWPSIIAHAREHGVKLTFENCPMIFSSTSGRAGTTSPTRRRSGAASSKPGATISA